MYGSIGKLGIAGTHLTTNQAIAFTNPQPIESKYLFYYLLNQRDELSRIGQGATQRNISQGLLKTFPFILAPLTEQHLIVTTVEQQFTRLDAGVTALRKAQAKLKRYRAAVLKAAVEGWLTEIWRTEHPTTEPASEMLERILKERRVKWEADLRAKGKDPAIVKYVEPAKPDTEDLPTLPEGWCWATVEQIGDVQLGRQRAPNTILDQM